MAVRTIGRGKEWPAAAARSAAKWVHLAAAPTFAIMALHAGWGAGAWSICSAMQQTSPLSGMPIMYVLMSAFHLAPWLKLISSYAEPTQREATRPGTSVFLIAPHTQELARFRVVDRSPGARRIRRSFHRNLARGTAR